LIRIGLGYDIHRLTVGRRLVLAGVEISHVQGLEGHSDADVVTHAVMDALLGAAGLPDIGQNFPTDDEQFRNASSMDLLTKVVEMIGIAGYVPINVDVVVVAEAPRISPYAQIMRSRLAHGMGIEPGRIGIKATTNEGVGPEGRSEAISAHAVALLESV
jgi:2-C-methyl-D-erythritol 2,4-cyclodiphosphate synthase